MTGTDRLPLVLVPGLASSARIYSAIIPALWRAGPVMVANHARDDSLAAIAARVLSEAPERFALAGHSMGGYIAFEILRQAPQRVAKLALLNSSARPDTPAATERRRQQMQMARDGRLHEVLDMIFPTFVHPARVTEAALHRLVHDMGDDVGVAGFVNNQTAIIARPDSRPGLASIRCPTLVVGAEQDALLPKELSAEIAAGIAGSRLVLVPDCGHLSQAERPDAVADALLVWLGASHGQ
ncbi:alpha/beta fold hydrolase [Bradyrhizobium sp. U87765 SZCCT0131]|uniref:alpha/beta fold hydrolase n=1 Tax=unclassified Bradyrhizobium TaxID=2631580 RepID=UPI001BAD1823|nr:MULTISPECIES: alpha/beta fold hydrolase [unclassified Bradyrhizobium]MBR1218612.1 alpha/beta fold hydrolase [Bradyrhizobium sp. U87765 SZCCT0131]MBR1265629.1 alpha/beta fold hydrolase [Bradyrhizobium sp. U87765 SZCCT0134]MBR1304110.1 alpha/beta fold hydrolase [Bradyrhizobium sp. U87765 SZCCT0110]MBR1319716.1 alpha/beta fold hydrolase [Bradyrhizobium sp. U87765 SZCCT0109]MBR1348041.1 alpha/beta fold hydrolase [Bradyrhizobium sp. U87765 SZCCT0048]